MCQVCYRFWEPHGDPGGMNPASTELMAGRGRRKVTSKEALTRQSSQEIGETQTFQAVHVWPLICYRERDPQKKEDTECRSLHTGTEGGLLEQFEVTTKHHSPLHEK